MRLASNDELERSVLGAILLRPENLAVLPSLEPGHFLSPRAKVVFGVVRNLEAKGLPIDVTTVGDELVRDGTLEAVGWDYLGTCTLSVPTIENAVEYARRVRDAALRRDVMVALGDVLAQANAGSEGGGELLTAALQKLTALDTGQSSTASTIGEIISRRLLQLEEIQKARINGTLTMTGYPTGVERLDEKLGGWQPGIMTIVAARPAMGKSSLGLATADACTAAGHGVHLFSLEDTEDSYADRVLSRSSKVPAENLRNCNLNRGQLADVLAVTKGIKARKHWLVDGRSGITADEIVREVRRRKRDIGTKVVIVDYIQLVKQSRKASTHEALTEIATTFSDAAKQDKLAYVVMSQLNRDIEKREDRRPQMSDLRESGSLEERAKCIVGLYRGSYYYDKPKKGTDYSENESPPSVEKFQRTIQLCVLKNNNGRIGRVFADWNAPLTRIE